MTGRLLSVLLAFSLGASVNLACAQAQDAPKLKELQRTKAGTLEVLLLSTRAALRQGKDSFVIEFRSAADQHPVDVGTVKVNATMTMAGMPPMIGNITAKRTDVGRYAVDSDLGMVGSWRLGLEWDGPAGKGSATMPGNVQ